MHGGIMSRELDATRKYLQTVIDIGSQMLSVGAEVERVEDSITRMCYAYGAQKVEAFAINYVIIVTISAEGGISLTESRRIHRYGRDLEKLTLLNDLSRTICEKHLTAEEAKGRLKEIRNTKRYNMFFLLLIYAVISVSFTLFFGGNARDAVVSAVVGCTVALVDRMLEKAGINRFVSLCICSIWMGALATLGVRIGIGCSVAKISIGNIMIFIPGLLFTNSIQEIFSDNMMTGLVRMVEAAVVSIVIASGFVLVDILI